MKTQRDRIWKREQQERTASKPQFYLTEKEKKDGQSSIIHRWLELADRLFESNNDDIDPTPSAA